jgi:hypothetical protein
MFPRTQAAKLAAMSNYIEDKHGEDKELLEMLRELLLDQEGIKDVVSDCSIDHPCDYWGRGRADFGCKDDNKYCLYYEDEGHKCFRRIKEDLVRRGYEAGKRAALTDVVVKSSDVTSDPPPLRAVGFANGYVRTKPYQIK